MVGDSNKFAYHAALMVAEFPGEKYNPLFIYGGTGLGKTHLLYAIKDYAEKMTPNIKIKYVQTSTFIDEFIATITLKRDKATFDQKYINNKIILFDDIQALSGTDATQGKFFDIFNLLYGSNSHIVAVERPPSERDTPAGRPHKVALRGRPADRHHPAGPGDPARDPPRESARGERGDPGRRAHLHRFQGQGQHPFAGGPAQPGRRFGAPLRDEDRPGDGAGRPQRPGHGASPVARRLVSTSSRTSWRTTTTSTVYDLTGKSRSRPLVHARQVAMYLCREMTDATLIGIGGQFGGRDHTTVIHSCRKIESLIKTKREIFQEVTELTNMINKSI